MKPKPNMPNVQLVGFFLCLYLHSTSSITCVVSTSDPSTARSQGGCAVCITNKSPPGPSQAIISRECSLTPEPSSPNCNNKLGGCTEKCVTECCNKFDSPCTEVSTGVSPPTSAPETKATPKENIPTQAPKPVDGSGNTGSQVLQTGCQFKVTLIILETLAMILVTNFV